MWDIGGQARYRHMWLRYCRSVDVIVFMVDSADEGMLLVPFLSIFYHFELV